MCICIFSLIHRRSVKVDVTKDSADIQYENTVGVVDDPMYYFIPVNRYGDNKSMTKPLENRGGCVNGMSKGPD